MSGRTLLFVAVVGTTIWNISPRNDVQADATEMICGAPAMVSLVPPSPVRGALFLVRVSGVARDARLAGDVGAERLHFAADSASFSALGATPIDGPDSVRVVIRCSTIGDNDSLVVRAPTASGNYPLERLTVAPAFGTPPDPPTAARIQRESQRAVEMASRAHDTPRLWEAPFIRPRDTRVTSGFGGGREYNGTISSRHMGTDFAGDTGAPVMAVNRGIVRIVDAFYYGGNVVYVDHGSGLSTAYLHLSAQLVQNGDTVQRGQVIGRIGATGRVTGPHLHLIARYGSVTVDPLSLPGM